MYAAHLSLQGPVFEVVVVLRKELTKLIDLSQAKFSLNEHSLFYPLSITLAWKWPIYSARRTSLVLPAASP